MGGLSWKCLHGLIEVVALQSKGIGKTTWNGSQHGCEHLSFRISMPLASAHSKVLINRWRRPQKKCTCFFLEAAWSLIAFRMHLGMEAWMMSPCIMKWHMFIRKHFPMTALLWGHCHWGETQRCIHGADSPPNAEASVRWFTWFLNQISEPRNLLATTISVYANMESSHGFILAFVQVACGEFWLVQGLSKKIDVGSTSRRMDGWSSRPMAGRRALRTEVTWLWRGAIPPLGTVLVELNMIFWNYLWSCLRIALVNLSSFIDQFRLF